MTIFSVTSTPCLAAISSHILKAAVGYQRTAACIAICVFLLHASATTAAIESAFDLSTQVEYEDNPQLLPDEQAESVWRSVTTPRYRLSRLEDTWSLAFSGDVRVQRSSNDQLSFDREDPTANLAFIRQSEAGELNMSVGFAQASTRITELEDSNLLIRDGTRETLSGSMEWRGVLSAVSAYGLTWSAQDVTFEDSPLVDFRSQTGGISYQRQLSELTTVSLVGRATRFDPQGTSVGGVNSVQQDILYGGLGVSYQLSQRWSTQLNGGVVDVTFGDDQPSTVQSPDTGIDSAALLDDSDGNWNVDGTINYKGERANWSLTVARQTNASGLGQAVTADSVSSSAGFQLSERSRLSLSLGWRNNRDVVDNESRNAQIAWARTINQSWSWQASYQYREQRGVNEADSNSVVLALVYRGAAF